MQLIRRAHLVVAWALVAGVVVQVFLAGLGVFERADRFAIHANWGYMLELLPVLMLILAAVGRFGRRQLVYAGALFAMFILQSIFVALRADLPMIAALHPVNGFGILLLAVVSAREAWVTRDATEYRAAVSLEPASGDAARQA
jgi:hypothetical protein